MKAIKGRHLWVATVGIALTLAIGAPLMAASTAQGGKEGDTVAAAVKIDSFSKAVFSQCPSLKKIMSQSPVNITSLIQLADQPPSTCSSYAQYTLGQFYSQGRGGLVQSYTKGASWYGKAASQGNASAQYSLGWLYARGEGVIQNYTQAVTWWTRSALQGNSSAQFFLAWAYSKGKGVPQSNGKAYAWLSVAVAYGVGSNLDISADQRATMQTQASQMRDKIGAVLAKADAKKSPPGRTLQQAKALANQYYQQTMQSANNAGSKT